jgi:hypothetical protein
VYVPVKPVAYLTRQPKLDLETNNEDDSNESELVLKSKVPTPIKKEKILQRKSLPTDKICNKRGSESEPNRCSLRHIYGVRRAQIILSTVVFWFSWQVCKPNRTCYKILQLTVSSSNKSGSTHENSKKRAWKASLKENIDSTRPSLQKKRTTTQKVV